MKKKKNKKGDSIRSSGRHFRREAAADKMHTTDPSNIYYYPRVFLLSIYYQQGELRQTSTEKLRKKIERKKKTIVCQSLIHTHTPSRNKSFFFHHHHYHHPKKKNGRNKKVVSFTLSFYGLFIQQFNPPKKRPFVFLIF
jgi:hypothetical protein